MIKGIMALFSLGIIFDPFVLLGIVLGFFIALTPDTEILEKLFKQGSFYALLFLLSFLYNFLLKKIYKENSSAPDYGAMFFNMIASVIKFALAALFSTIFVAFFLSF